MKIRNVLILLFVLPFAGICQTWSTQNVDSLLRKTTSIDDSSVTLIYKLSKNSHEIRIKTRAKEHLDFLITKDMIYDQLNVLLKQNQSPDWAELATAISARFGKETADRNIINAQFKWYKLKKDTVNMVKYVVKRIDRYGIDTVGFEKANLNNLVYYIIFKKYEDRIILKKAVNWMKKIVALEPKNGVFIDTYANLLYKLGQKKEAMQWQRKAIALDPGNSELREAWKKMQQNLPTWLVPGGTDGKP
jgi:tetratricopeptide (TPR) repeat protein